MFETLEREKMNKNGLYYLEKRDFVKSVIKKNRIADDFRLFIKCSKSSKEGKCFLKYPSLMIYCFNVLCSTFQLYEYPV